MQKCNHCHANVPESGEGRLACLMCGEVLADDLSDIILTGVVFTTPLACKLYTTPEGWSVDHDGGRHSRRMLPDG